MFVFQDFAATQARLLRELFSDAFTASQLAWIDNLPSAFGLRRKTRILRHTFLRLANLQNC